MVRSMPAAQSTKPATSNPEVLRIQNFAHVADANLTLGDLTVVVGPQGAGKSLALQWLKVALDGKQLVDALKASGHPTDRPDVLIDLIFGSGMAPSWVEGETRVKFGRRTISLSGIGRIGNGGERLFFVPAHRSMLISDGWAAPFQKLNAETPAVARLFSQNLFDRFSGKASGTLFPVERRLKKEIRDKIDAAVFHGGRVGIEEDAQHALRLRLVHGDMHLPFMTWTAGQREFTPLLLGLYHILPSTKVRKRSGTDWVVIEEPEMGLHPQAVTAVMLLVLDLLWRGYRVVMSTHSPHVLTLLWMMKRLQEHNARWQLVCQAFGVRDPKNMHLVAKAALQKDYRAHLMDLGEDGKVRAVDISTLDPDAADERIAGWGGLTEYSSHFGDAVRMAVNESEK
jgi:energy-coupling factor transporter ATP-binding protein EcfA2